MITPTQLKSIRQDISTAARSAFSSIREAYPNDKFYSYVLWTTGVIHRPAPCAFSEEGLKRVMEKYKESDASNLRWSEADSPFDCYGDQYFKKVEQTFRLFGDPYERSNEDRQNLLGAIIGAMQDLDDSSFFGSGTERANLVINVTLPGEEDEDSVIERAKRLNPPESLITLCHDLTQRTRRSSRHLPRLFS